jgi:hypothetical protein
VGAVFRSDLIGERPPQLLQSGPRRAGGADPGEVAGQGKCLPRRPLRPLMDIRDVAALPEETEHVVIGGSR